MALMRQDTVLVTGASRGIGFACAERLLSEYGCQVAITARDPAGLEAARQQLAEKGRVIALQCDHADSKQIANSWERLLQLTGPPAGVIANVGDNPVHRLGPRKAHNADYDVLLSCLRTNLVNTLYLLQLCIKEWRSRGGNIVLIGSQAYRYGIPGQIAYNVSKSGLVGLKNSLVSEYGKRGIYCQLVNPGLVLNERTRRLRATVAEQTISEAEVAAAVCQALWQPEQFGNGAELNVPAA
ncbi:hypothetical protein CAI21_19275 [Alkalilimnicola ehrlichii]|uniref:Ketoreductase domain-containing protein n=1 Tax=Alkalilimnicola ehrlichii TaxID=351052 RepID=A0A3E0WK13_9GAMM|nr:SDR family oxidoreductase [Alkalilimnicola ehrlichii]RFA25377.1 hypothetical protein CAI21_19275 [Alkalilimnicola ehrlichii]RFA32553.1 hypothetical protein CAL65_19540 [Alkalilimnicola ehrlichii]